LYVAGGKSASSSLGWYDVASNTWTAIASTLVVRWYFGAVTIGSAGPAEGQDHFDSLIAKNTRRGD
jgi:hypothetical protein